MFRFYRQNILTFKNDFLFLWKKNVKYSFQYCFIIIIPDDQVFVSDMFEYTDVVCDKFSTVL